LCLETVILCHPGFVVTAAMGNALLPVYPKYSHQAVAYSGSGLQFHFQFSQGEGEMRLNYVRTDITPLEPSDPFDHVLHAVQGLLKWIGVKGEHFWNGTKFLGFSIERAK
jgi:hypothetical protein